MGNPTVIQDETDLADQWTGPQLGHKLATDPDCPETDAWVLRVLAARLSARAASARDPRSVAVDISKALESLSEAIGGVMTTEADPADPDDTERVEDVRAARLTTARAGTQVVHLANWF